MKVILVKTFSIMLAVFQLTAHAMGPPGGLTCPAPNESTTAGSVIVNEFSYHGDGAQNDWIELYVNSGPQNLDGWQLILKGPGNNDDEITLGSIDIPWSDTASNGRFIIIASSVSDSSIQAAIDSGNLTLNDNLFIQPDLSLHNTTQEIMLVDDNGNLVYYIANGNVNNPKFEYDCADVYPDYADEIRENGNEDQACTAVDGASNGNVNDDWEAGCNGETTPGSSNSGDDDTVIACSNVFADGASTHNVLGSISFGFNARLIDSNNNQLATGSISKNGGSSSQTCDTSDCVATGESAEAASTLNFESTSSTVDVNFGFQDSVVIGEGSFSGNEFDDINTSTAAEATITFSNNNSEYFVNNVTLGFKNILYLQGGSTYWFDEFVLGSQSEVIIQGTGTAIIYVNQDLSFPSPGLINSPSINSSGDASKLVIHGFSNVTFNNDSTFTGSLYAGGNLTLGSSSYAFGATSAANISLGSQSTITYQIDDVAQTDYRNFCTASEENVVNHYRIEHDTQGFTCEAEAITIKACANESCTELFDQPTKLTLSPTGFSGGDTFTFTGEQSALLSVTDDSLITFAKLSANPNADLRCFNGATETCNMTFSDDGFEIYGANIGDPLQDQLAADNFINVNLRAVRDNAGVCEALLEGDQDITLGFDCDTPDVCLSPLSNINVGADPSGYSFATVTVEFDENGIAKLNMLNYADAGRLKLQAQAVIDGVTFNASDEEVVDIYPSYLALGVDQSELIYTATGDQNNYVAGENFTLKIGAYGTNNLLLPNYQAAAPEIKVTRITPFGTGEDGSLAYSNTGSRDATNSANFAAAIGLAFSGGEHNFNTAYYTDVGRIEVDAKDNNYLGNEILSNGAIILGDFYPAYFTAELTQSPTLADTCGTTFSYLGESIEFATPPELTITAYNALGDITFNYSDNYWSYQPDEATLEANLSYLDSSVYAATVANSASVIELGDAPDLTENTSYDGQGVLTFTNGSFRYNKMNPANDAAYSPASPFAASIDLQFASDFFKTSFTDQNGSTDTICLQANHTDNTCLGFNIEDITGTQIRYGRLVLESTYGPETDPIAVPIKAQYFSNGQWLVNTDDNCTSIAFNQSATHLLLSGNSDIIDNVGTVTSTGQLLLGVADDSGDFLLNAPNVSGEIQLQLNPAADPTGWFDYLNFDWDGDGFITSADYPEANISFGLYRGNDKIIHWREVFH